MERQGDSRKRMQELIHNAVENNDLGQLRILLKHASPQIMNHRGQGGLTPLLRASQSGFHSMVRILLENGARIDDKDDDGNTCLHYAAREQNHDLVQLLLKSCARTFERNRKGQLPVDLASESTAELISDKMMKDGPTEFVAACQRMNSRICNKSLPVVNNNDIVKNPTRSVSLPAYFQDDN